MRDWITLVEAAQLSEQWHNTFETPGGQVDVFADPSPAEFNKLLVQVTKQHGETPLPFRASIAPDGTLYIWDAFLATHSDIITAHGVPTVGGYLYLARNHIVFNDLNWEYDEETEDETKPYGRWVRTYYNATKACAALQRIYGRDMKIVGRDDEDRFGIGLRGEFTVDDAFIERFVNS